MNSSKLWHDSFDVITDAVSLHDLNYRILTVNKAFSGIFNIQPSEAVGKQCYELIHKLPGACSGCPFKEALATGKACTVEIYESSIEAYLEVSAYPVFDDKGNIEGILHIVKNITGRKHLEEAISRSHEELESRVRERTSELQKAHARLRGLAAHLQSVREEERMKIAREIHDELGQPLSAQKMQLSWFRTEYGDHKPIFDKAGEMLDALNSMMKSLKRICTELRPSILDDFGLVEAMKWQAAEFHARTRIECAVDSIPEEIWLDKRMSIALFRIFQEALSNILKHARASKVTARVTKSDETLTLEIIDNGRGATDEQLSKSQSFGLRGMRERVYPWRGEVKITGYKNMGTTVKVMLPLPPGKPPLA